MSKHPYHERKVRAVEAERDQARREIERLTERLEAKTDVMDRLEAERDEAWTEVARLQTLLRDIETVWDAIGGEVYASCEWAYDEWRSAGLDDRIKAAVVEG